MFDPYSMNVLLYFFAQNVRIFFILRVWKSNKCINKTVDSFRGARVYIFWEKLYCEKYFRFSNSNGSILNVFPLRGVLPLERVILWAIFLLKWEHGLFLVGGGYGSALKLHNKTCCRATE